MQTINVPPKCIGIMGGGQLARMLAIAAKQMGYQVAILEAEENCPAKLFANYHIQTKYDDRNGLDQLAKISSVITTEFENVPANSMSYLARQTDVYPQSSAIAISQNRIVEKDFLNQHQIKTTKYFAINALKDVENVSTDLFPGILKTNTLGYDGKGQLIVSSKTELITAFTQLKQVPCILEKMVELAKEVSIMVARNTTEIITYPTAENIHINGILDTTIAPARINHELQIQIEQAAKIIIEKLDYIGILGIEFFITKDNQILVNEMAPRTHNSGHYTIDACLTSQFEQQVRSICNLKLGETRLLTNAVMLNLLGDIWLNNPNHDLSNDLAKLLGKYPNLKLHLYDKIKVKIGRKMGHLTILGDDINLLLDQLNHIKQQIGQT